MTEKGASNDTILIVNAIKEQTIILKEMMHKLDDRITNLENEVKEHQRKIDELGCKKCIYETYTFNGLTLTMKTIIILIFLMVLFQLILSYTVEDVMKIVFNYL